MKSLRITVLSSAALLVAALASAQEPADRVGIEENFDALAGWRKIDFPGETAPLKEMRVENGVALFVTHPAPLSTYKDRPSWLDGMTGHDAFSNIARDFPETDLDRYRYLVMKIDEKSTPCSVIVNRVDLPVAYTTGVHAVDLSLYEDLRGKRPVEFRIQFLNTGMQVRMDWFRFVSELTPEEKKGLIPAGLVLRLDRLEPDPMQGLDAVMQRADRPRRDALPAEKLCFRDTATGAVIWRMTGREAGTSIVSDSARSTFNLNGSVMLFSGYPGGPHFYDFVKDEFLPARYADTSRFSPTDADVLWCVEKTLRPAGIRFHRINIRTGADEVAGEIDFAGKQFRTSLADLGFAENTDQVAVGFRESPQVYVLNPDEHDPAKRLREITLPMRLKGMGLSPEGDTLFWNRCYWYESWQMDLATGKVARRPNFGGSHAGSGGGLQLGHHAGLIISAPAGNTDPAPGDKVQILLNYRSGWHTDYGHLVNDRQWYIANGTAGDMTNQLIMAETRDPGTVLQVARQNTSRNNWGCNTVIRSSTDYTKLTWVSNIWGYDAVCIAFTRRPEPPYGFTGKRDGDAVELRWQRPRMGGRAAFETMGYNVYRSVENGPFLPLNDEPVTAESWRDEDLAPDKLYQYIVCKVEYCGLESVPTNAFVALPIVIKEEKSPAHQLHIEAEHGIYVTPPARQAFNGWTSAFRYVRIRKQLESENVGTVQLDVTPQFDGDYAVWLRVRAEDKPGQWTARVGGQDLGALAVADNTWRWARLDNAAKLKAGERARIVLSSADDGLCLDKVLLAQDRNYVPKTLDDRFSVPPPKPEYLVTEEVTTSSVKLAWWNPHAPKDLDYCNVYVGQTPDFPTDQAHRVCSTRRTVFLDWGLAPGRDYTYKLTAVNRRGLESEPIALTVKTEPVAERVVLELPIDRATLDKRLKVETQDGVRCAFRPYEGPGHEKDPPVPVTWEFDLPVRGEYMIWCQYAPADQYYTRLRLPVKLDDFLGGKAIWQMRTPYRAMSGPRYRLWKEDLWFVDKVSMYVWPRPHDLFKLSAGRHKLTLELSPEMKEFHHKIGTLWITNDPSFRPPGWDAQADFTKAKIQRR